MIIVDTAGVLTHEQPNRMKVAVRRVGAATGRTRKPGTAASASSSSTVTIASPPRALSVISLPPRKS